MIGSRKPVARFHLFLGRSKELLPHGITAGYFIFDRIYEPSGGLEFLVPPDALALLRHLDESAVARHVIGMTPAQILGEIQQLPFQEQSRIYEALKELVLKQGGSSALTKVKRADLVHAARALRSDYESDPELTAFTALDGEDFHAAR